MSKKLTEGIHLGYYTVLMGFEPGDDPKYQVSAEDARVIKAFQVMKAFNCLDLSVYRKNPAWFNEACYTLIRTENKAEMDKYEESK